MKNDAYDEIRFKKILRMLPRNFKLLVNLIKTIQFFKNSRFKAIGGIEDIIGSIDGTHFILRNAPTKDKKFILPGRKDMLCIVRFEISVGEKIIEVWTRQIKISEDLTNITECKQHNFRSTLLRYIYMLEFNVLCLGSSFLFKDAIIQLKADLCISTDQKSKKNGNKLKKILLSDEKWSLLDQLIDILMPFEKATCEFSGNIYVTLSQTIPTIIKARIFDLTSEVP
ncbi:hypothetical protein RhiirA4_549779 [Rhizophagus irregularis]|uniref:Uncharacterized protein n=1 Tax=Rhizophagus irregularis TaxID=588596 RepID=A0A2I1HFS3_9GLOM|nr:hypothetical protein RhiirA4_549779 [Rhizophagus irregularis]